MAVEGKYDGHRGEEIYGRNGDEQRTKTMREFNGGMEIQDVTKRD